MNLLDLPSEIVELCTKSLSVKDFGNWRLVFKTNWRNAHIYNNAYRKINTLEKKKRKRCLVCCHDCLTELLWENNNTREWIPWCALHTNPSILCNVEAYCIGSLDVNGNSLIY